MFSLVITIIAILLVGALAIATMYYGGSALNKSSAMTSTAQLMTEANQISGAFELYKVDHGVTSLPTGTVEQIKQAMMDQGYLKAWPAHQNANMPQWSLTNDYAILTGITVEQCNDINAKYGISPTPSCSDPSIEGKSLCCVQ